ncbi:unnamed protein product, partial [Onchocerca flexuosa]|uniref:F-box domain-containing protein n=1 Tax=Onchocerca flexuosa TaxID=387005 RepID=A0A183HR41_9BILA
GVIFNYGSYFWTYVVIKYQFNSIADISTLRSEYSIMQDESKGLLSLLDEIIIRIIEKLNSEDIANIADTCIRLREKFLSYHNLKNKLNVVRKMSANDESLSDFSIESIDELELDCA